MWDKSKMTDHIVDWLWKTEDLIFIDVADAEKSNTGNGHAYFRQSPWVSSETTVASNSTAEMMTPTLRRPTKSIAV